MPGKIHPVILCGGSGTRLWPLSRGRLPKQFHALSGEASLLQGTVARMSEPGRYGAPVIICNDQHRHLVAEQLRAIEVAPERLLLEPLGRNTAPAAAVAALVLGDSDPDALLLLLPSDHFIADRPGFLAAVEQAAAAASEGWLVTFGVQPDAPETGYGYIKRGEGLAALDNCYRVDRFVEKPDCQTAEGYLRAGDFSWNSGMFLFSAKRLIAELEQWQPEILAASRRAIDAGRKDGACLFLDPEAFGACPSDSIDYAVMEKTERAAIVPVDIGWTDIGSWGALWEFADKDDRGNATSGDVIAIDTHDCYLRSEGQLLASVGAKDLIVVVTDDAILIADRKQSQDIKSVVDQLKNSGRKEHQDHRQSHHAWGQMINDDGAFGHAVDRLLVKVGAGLAPDVLSKDSLWVVLAGVAEATLDDDLRQLEAGQSLHVPAGAITGLSNAGDSPLSVLRVLYEEVRERPSSNQGLSVA